MYIYIYICIHTVDGSEILHHLGCTKPINWCRISSINNIYVYICTYFSLGWSDLHQSKMEQWKANSSFVELKHGVIIIPTQTKRYCKGNPSKLQYICIVWMTPVKEMQEFWNQIKKKTECHDYWSKLSLTLPRARRSKGRSNKVRRKCDLIRTHSSVASRLLTSPYYTMVGDFHHEKYKSIWHHLPLSGDSFQPKKNMFKPPTTYSRFRTFYPETLAGQFADSWSDTGHPPYQPIVDLQVPQRESGSQRGVPHQHPGRGVDRYHHATKVAHTVDG